MIKQQLTQDLADAINKAGYKTADIVISIPENDQFGDYSTNISLQLANQKLNKNHHSSVDIANQIVEHLGHPSYLARVDVAGPGFINFSINDEALVRILNEKVLFEKRSPSGSKYLVEFGHTNPLKEVHIGHLRTFILGESLSRILDFVGGEVFRANYQGDIGLHIAKAVWGIQKVGLPKKDLTLAEKAKFMGQCYAQGNEQYEKSPAIKKQIDEINLKLYQSDPSLQKIYQLAREWSLDYFKPIYEALDIKYDRCFFESEVFAQGKAIVLQNVGPIFEKNDGAIIFPGEKYGLHTRVFITSAGNPTYEGKEIGLAKLEYDTFNYDQSIHVVASEQAGYFQVVFKAVEMIFPNLVGKKYHLSYGLVDLKQGKMSSRTGNVVTFDQLVTLVKNKLAEVMSDESKKMKDETAQKVALGAIKFAYLSFSPSTNMVFDLNESVSIHGDSGPYVLYCYARTQSVLRNVSEEKRITKKVSKAELTPEEREVLRVLEQFPAVIEQAAIDLQPHQLIQFLLRLAKAFNHFYELHAIIKSDQEDFRLTLTIRVAEVLKTGLTLLGIDAPERM